MLRPKRNRLTGDETVLMHSTGGAGTAVAGTLGEALFFPRSSKPVDMWFDGVEAERFPLGSLTSR